MRRIGVVFTIGVLVGCAQHGPSPQSPPTTPVTAVAAPRTPADCDRLFAERLVAGDVEGVVALYEPTATLVGPDGKDAAGTDAIRTELAAIIAMQPTMTMHVKRIVTAGDVAVLYNDWHGTLTDPKGKRIRIAGKASEVVRRQPDGSWRFVIDAADARGRR